MEKSQLVYTYNIDDNKIEFVCNEEHFVVSILLSGRRWIHQTAKNTSHRDGMLDILNNHQDNLDGFPEDLKAKLIIEIEKVN